jgi:hypothetical protein
VVADDSYRHSSRMKTAPARRAADRQVHRTAETAHRSVRVQSDLRPRRRPLGFFPGRFD